MAKKTPKATGLVNRDALLKAERAVVKAALAWRSAYDDEGGNFQRTEEELLKALDVLDEIKGD